ncbi:hypothetical protein CVT25_001466 [Psilocybe cyanescens]|uniref:Uncharacterized protein n=1 Tax=Psilocybe cyanescens TaxID=93625 RepID=A0A409W6C3_PSICY|nr:hypothetical protein CVT25_001466 [Psilocybe cyanescens]
MPWLSHNTEDGENARRMRNWKMDYSIPRRAGSPHGGAGSSGGAGGGGGDSSIGGVPCLVWSAWSLLVLISSLSLSKNNTSVFASPGIFLHISLIIHCLSTVILI